MERLEKLKQAQGELEQLIDVGQTIEFQASLLAALEEEFADRAAVIRIGSASISLPEAIARQALNALADNLRESRERWQEDADVWLT